jgi:alpha-maltose-1-phosphate synthase
VRVALLSKEYPPEVYGGAGVHVEYLARELAHLVNVDVHCFGGDRPDRGAAPRVFAYRSWDRLAGPAPHLAALQAMAVDLAIAAGVEGVDVVHSHTWYANFAGHVAKLIYGVPHVCTVHSLEPMRPWKAEQLGGGYRLSTFCEQTALEHADAVIAVSNAVRDDVLACYPAVDAARVHVVHNGIDPIEWHPDNGVEALKRHGVDPTAPTVIFVGRVTRQKGIQYLLEAAKHLDPSVQIVLRAGSPDTPELGQELARQVDALRARRSNVVWIEAMVERWEVIQLLTHADVFCCPSIYEPLGLVNLEAMACETAVVGSAVGGIPEVVADGDSGILVPFVATGEHDPTPAEPETFTGDLAAALNAVLNDPGRAAAMGRAGRQRVVEHFSWSAIAQRTLDLYRSVDTARADAPGSGAR